MDKIAKVGDKIRVFRGAYKGREGIIKNIESSFWHGQEWIYICVPFLSFGVDGPEMAGPMRLRWFEFEVVRGGSGERVEA